MSNVRKISYLANVECVSSDVRDAVGALRQWLGYKTVTALHRIVSHCRTTPRRIRTLFERDQAIAVSDDERRNLALSIADLWDSIGDECGAREEKCRVKADEIRYRERQQLILPLGGDNTWSGSGRNAASGSGAWDGREAA